MWERLLSDGSVSVNQPLMPFSFLTGKEPAHAHADTPHYTYALHSSSEMLRHQYVMD